MASLRYKARPLQNGTFCPISVSGSNFNPRNILYIPVVVRLRRIAFLELEQKLPFFKGLKAMMKFSVRNVQSLSRSKWEYQSYNLDTEILKEIFLLKLGQDTAKAFEPISKRPLSKSTLICPISASGSNFNPRNTTCIPVVKIFAFLDLEQN
jgi:hypothetical protein